MQVSNRPTGSPNYSLMLQSTNSHALSSTKSEQNDWLSNQFRRFPFILYKIWLILNFATSTLAGLNMIYSWYEANFSLAIQRSDISITISFFCYLYGSCQMLYAIEKKKSRIAQEGFVKFQYDLISSLIGLVHRTEEANFNGSLLWLFWCFSPVIHLTGGYAVLKTFKDNHPLTRKEKTQVSEEIDEDFLKQNEAIASEFTKFDEKLESWPYFLYKCLLQFTVVFEIFFTWNYTLYFMVSIIWMAQIKNEGLSIDFYFLIGLVMISLLNAFSCFQMEVAMRTRGVEKTKTALLLLKAFTVFAISKCLFAVKYSSLRETFNVSETLPSHFFWIGCFVVAPVLTLIGAFKVKTILVQRDNFVKFSSYPEDTYL